MSSEIVPPPIEDLTSEVLNADYPLNTHPLTLRLNYLKNDATNRLKKGAERCGGSVGFFLISYQVISVAHELKDPEQTIKNLIGYSGFVLGAGILASGINNLATYMAETMEINSIRNALVSALLNYKPEEKE